MKKFRYFCAVIFLQAFTSHLTQADSGLLGGGSGLPNQLLGITSSLLNPELVEGVISLPFGTGAAQSPLETLGVLSGTGAGFLLNPETLLGLGRPLIVDLVPVVGVLTTNPAGILDYLLMDGGIFASSLAPIPAIPLLSQPLGF